MRHFRAMCSEKRQDFLAARDDYNAMALQSKQMHEKVAATQGRKLARIYWFNMCCLCMLRNATCMKQTCM